MQNTKEIYRRTNNNRLSLTILHNIFIWYSSYIYYNILLWQNCAIRRARRCPSINDVAEVDGRCPSSVWYRKVGWRLCAAICDRPPRQCATATTCTKWTWQLRPTATPAFLKRLGCRRKRSTRFSRTSLAGEHRFVEIILIVILCPSRIFHESGCSKLL